jgi:hypothetical protein
METVSIVTVTISPLSSHYNIAGVSREFPVSSHPLLASVPKNFEK